VGGRAAFFPVFPGLIRVGGGLLGSPLIAGILISSSCGLGGLYFLHRLVALDFGLERARTVVWLAAWFPGALVISAVYSESLFLFVSVGAIYAARLGRWPLAGMLGAAAAATRSGGVIVVVPMLIIYLYGPRLDQPARDLVRGLWPRYRPRADILWLLLGVPAGLAAFVLYLGVSTGDPTSFFSHRPPGIAASCRSAAWRWVCGVRSAAWRSCSSRASPARPRPIPMASPRR